MDPSSGKSVNSNLMSSIFESFKVTNLRELICTKRKLEELKMSGVPFILEQSVIFEFTSPSMLEDSC